MERREKRVIGRSVCVCTGGSGSAGLQSCVQWRARESEAGREGGVTSSAGQRRSQAREKAARVRESEGTQPSKSEETEE